MTKREKMLSECKARLDMAGIISSDFRILTLDILSKAIDIAEIEYGSDYTNIDVEKILLKVMDVSDHVS